LIQFDNIPILKKSNFDDKDTEINICWTSETGKSINQKYMQIAAKRVEQRIIVYFRGFHMMKIDKKQQLSKKNSNYSKNQ
jgi:hypothetical protein